MKKIEVLITPFKIDEVKEALVKIRVKSMIFSEVRDYSRQLSHVGNYRGSEYVVDLLPEIKIEVVVEDDGVKEVTDTIIGVLRTGHLTDGKISVLPMETVLYVRAGVH